MKQIFFYLSRCLISLSYCMIFGLIINLAFKIDWGSGVIMGGFIMLVIGLLQTSGYGNSMPTVVQSNPTTNAIDSTAIRTAMDVGTIARKEEQTSNTSKLKGPIKKIKPHNILDYIFKRTYIELIIHGILGIAIGLSTYMEYFV